MLCSNISPKECDTVGFKATEKIVGPCILQTYLATFEYPTRLELTYACCCFLFVYCFGREENRRTGPEKNLRSLGENNISNKFKSVITSLERTRTLASNFTMLPIMTNVFKTDIPYCKYAISADIFKNKANKTS